MRPSGGAVIWAQGFCSLRSASRSPPLGGVQANAGHCRGRCRPGQCWPHCGQRGGTGCWSAGSWQLHHGPQLGLGRPQGQRPRPQKCRSYPARPQNTQHQGSAQRGSSGHPLRSCQPSAPCRRAHHAQIPWPQPGAVGGIWLGLDLDNCIGRDAAVGVGDSPTSPAPSIGTRPTPVILGGTSPQS